MKLTGFIKWVSVKNKIPEKYGACLNFSFEHNFFLSPFRYVRKRNQEIAHSENHPPDFWQLPLQKPKVNFWIFYCICHKKEVRRRIIFLWCCKEAKCLTNLDLGFILEFIRERGFRSYIEFLFIVDEQRTAGQMDIAEFVFKRNEKILRELVTKIGKWSQRKKN